MKIKLLLITMTWVLSHPLLATSEITTTTTEVPEIDNSSSVPSLFSIAKKQLLRAIWQDPKYLVHIQDNSVTDEKSDVEEEKQDKTIDPYEWALIEKPNVFEDYFPEIERIRISRLAITAFSKDVFRTFSLMSMPQFFKSTPGSFYHDIESFPWIPIVERRRMNNS